MKGPFPSEEIKRQEDVLNYIYWKIGTIDMEEVRDIVDLVLKYKSLFKNGVVE